VLAANQIVGRTRMNGTEAVGLTKRGIAQNGRHARGMSQIPWLLFCCAACLATGTALKQRAKRVFCFCLLLNKCDTRSQAGWKRATCKNGVYDCRVNTRKRWQIRFVCRFVCRLRDESCLRQSGCKVRLWNGGDAAQ
jgi:hypothetical protein